MYRLAAPMGRVWRRKILVHFKLDSSTLWQSLWLAFQVRHPRTKMHRAAVQQQLRVMNTTRRALSAWSTARWYHHGAVATESVLRRALREIGREIVEVTAELRHREGRPTLQLRGTRGPVRSRGQTWRYTRTRVPASGEGLVIRVSDKWWG